MKSLYYYAEWSKIMGEATKELLTIIVICAWELIPEAWMLYRRIWSRI